MPTRDALPQLPQLGTIEHRIQIELADQHNLQQLLIVALEVGEQAHLLEYLWLQVLRLVNKDDGVRAERHAAIR